MAIETNIVSLIPQRFPFVMVDALESCDDTSAKTTFTVKQENIFTRNGILGEPALIENVAQTAAARIGYICKKENKPVPVGFIGAVQRLKVFSMPHTGDVLTTEVIIKNQVFNATIAEGNIYVGNEMIASCEIKIFVNQ